MIAGAFRAPELAIGQTEGVALAQAIAEVQAHYGDALDPKTQAWVNFGIVAASVYGPRVWVMRERMRAERDASRESEAALVPGAKPRRQKPKEEPDAGLPV